MSYLGSNDDSVRVVALLAFFNRISNKGWKSGAEVTRSSIKHHVLHIYVNDGKISISADTHAGVQGLKQLMVDGKSVIPIQGRSWTARLTTSALILSVEDQKEEFSFLLTSGMSESLNRKIDISNIKMSFSEFRGKGEIRENIALGYSQWYKQICKEDGTSHDLNKCIPAGLLILRPMKKEKNAVEGVVKEVAVPVSGNRYKFGRKKR